MSEENNEKPTQSAEIEEIELSEDELDEASGGIIIVGGNPVTGFKSRAHLNFRS